MTAAGDLAELGSPAPSSKPVSGPAPSADWPGLTLSEGFRLDQLAGAGVRAVSREGLYELRSLVGKALYVRPGRERRELSLDRRIMLRGLRQAAPAELSRRHQAFVATRPARSRLLDERGREVDERDPVAVRRAVGLKLKREAEARRRWCAMTPQQRFDRSQRIKRDRIILQARLRWFPALRIVFARGRGVARRPRLARRATLRRSPGRPADADPDPLAALEAAA